MVMQKGITLYGKTLEEFQDPYIFIKIGIFIGKEIANQYNTT